MAGLGQRLVSEIIDSLCMEQGLLIVAGQNLDSIAPQGEWETEKWYRTQYKADNNFLCKACAFSSQL
jgi:hypothetical protein